MKQDNFFQGESWKALLALIVYKQLMTGEWMDYFSCMKEYYSPKQMHQLSNCPEYRSLKKAFKAVKDALENKHKGCIEEKGNNRSKKFRYINEDKSPLSDLQNAVVIHDIKRYFQFCQDSAGLMPSEWLDYFFKNTKDLLEIKKRRKDNQQIIKTDERLLRNIGLLPIIYEYISHQEPFRYRYKTFSGKTQIGIIHPHFLREFNGRWFLLGYADGQESPSILIRSIDRFEGEIENVEGVSYIKPDIDLYMNRLSNMVGVSIDNNDADSATINEVRIRVYGQYMWGLVTTKKFHHSQITSMAYDKDNGYGEITINVIINNELKGRILHYGESVEVLSPQKLRDDMRNKVTKMSKLYEND